jgi:hypothetical protein
MRFLVILPVFILRFSTKSSSFNTTISADDINKQSYFDVSAHFGKKVYQAKSLSKKYVKNTVIRINNIIGHVERLTRHLQPQKCVWNEAYHFFLIKEPNAAFRLIIKHNLIFTIAIKAFQIDYKALKISYLCEKNLHIYFKLT